MVEKLLKYKEISKMWGLKTETVPVVIRALGLVKKVLVKYVEKIPGNINIEGLQKISPLDEAHFFTKSALYQLNNVSPKKMVASRSSGQ